MAVLEIMPSGSPRLYPVTLMMEGKFYDASLYAAKPVPFALYSDTVYEAQKSGMPVGMFTVQRAGRVENTWWGEGRWKPLGAEVPATPKSPDSKTAAKDDKTGLKEGKPADAKAAATPDDPDRPVLHRPKADVPAEPQVKATPPGAETPAEQKRAAKAADEDPNRPTLRRGRPSDADKEEPLPTSPIAGGGLPGKTPAKAKGTPTATYLAVSDAAPYDNRPYDYPSDAAEQDHVKKMATELAVAELRKFASGSGRQLPSAVTLTNVVARAYDLDYSNAPYVILSGEHKLACRTGKGWAR